MAADGWRRRGRWRGRLAEFRSQARADVTFYVNPATYVPVLAVWRNTSHWRDGKLMRGTVRQVISLLPPTPANQAKVEVTIPASFRQVHGAPFGGPVFPYFTSG